MAPEKHFWMPWFMIFYSSLYILMHNLTCFYYFKYFMTFYKKVTMPQRWNRESKYVKAPHIPELSRLSMQGQFSFFLVDQKGMRFLQFGYVFLLFGISVFHLLISCHTRARVRVGLPSFRSCPPMPTRENFALFLPSSTAWLQFSNWGHKVTVAKGAKHFLFWEQL